VSGELEVLRPDFVIRHESSKSVFICDVTVPFENRWVAFEDARAWKIANYLPLTEELQQQGYRGYLRDFYLDNLSVTSRSSRDTTVIIYLRTL
ncbi:hypothetical protein ALC56_00152, partial [Trachymyrmex septentrionalis]